ncbi:MAG TPA: VWA domain-containing protein [Bacteroidales bacterium]|nr:VWA domain-containing protein [Bacteroidales bacterium]
MKKLGLLVIFAHLIIFAHAQGSAKYSLRFYDNKSKAIANTEISLIETSTKERKVYKTDANGSVSIELNTGREWSVNILKIREIKFLNVPEQGTTNGNFNIVYDYKNWERKHREPFNRSNVTFTIIDQSTLKAPRPTEELAVVKLKVLKDNKTPLKNFPVQITNYSTLKIYKGVTNASGIATFLVPIHQEYDVDIDNIAAYDIADVLRGTGFYEFEVIYEPTIIVEKEINDTITQKLPPNCKGTSSRAYLKVTVDYRGTKSIEGQYVYLQNVATNKVYKAAINKNNQVEFLVPSKSKYMLHFEYEKDVDVISYTNSFGIINSSLRFPYTPKPELENPHLFIPNVEQLFIEEFEKFITHTIPPPTGDSKVRLDLRWGNNQVNELSKEAVLQIGIATSTDKTGITGPPLNIAIVVDKSGSMYGRDKIDALKNTLLNFVTSLRPNDIVSLVTFESNGIVVVPANKVGNGSYLRDMILDIQAGGGTDIYTGMMLGYKEIVKNFSAEYTNRLILLTDGYDSRPTQELLDASKTYTSKGIELSAIGVGSSYNQALLTLLSEQGNGNLYFAYDTKDISGSYEKELANLVSPLIKNFKLEIVYSPQITFKQLYGLKWKKSEANTVKVSIDKLYASYTKTALVAFNLNETDKKIEKNPLLLRVSYYDIQTKKNVAFEEKAYLVWSESTGNLELIIESELKKIYAIAIMNQSFKVIAEAYSQKDYVATQKAIDATMEQIKKLYDSPTDPDINKFIKAMQSYSEALKQIQKIEKQNNKNK